MKKDSEVQFSDMDIWAMAINLSSRLDGCIRRLRRQLDVERIRRQAEQEVEAVSEAVDEYCRRHGWTEPSDIPVQILGLLEELKEMPDRIEEEFGRMVERLDLEEEYPDFEEEWTRAIEGVVRVDPSVATSAKYHVAREAVMGKEKA